MSCVLKFIVGPVVWSRTWSHWGTSDHSARHDNAQPTGVCKGCIKGKTGIFTQYFLETMMFYSAFDNIDNDDSIK